MLENGKYIMVHFRRDTNGRGRGPRCSHNSAPCLHTHPGVPALTPFTEFLLPLARRGLLGCCLGLRLRGRGARAAEEHGRDDAAPELEHGVEWDLEGCGRGTSCCTAIVGRWAVFGGRVVRGDRAGGGAKRDMKKRGGTIKHAAAHERGGGPCAGRGQGLTMR